MLSAITASPTMAVTPTNCLTLMLKRTTCLLPLPFALLGSDAFFFRPLASSAQLVQLVVQGLQTDPEDLRRTRLVVTCVLEGHQDQPGLSLLHRRARRQRQRRFHD